MHRENVSSSSGASVAEGSPMRRTPACAPSHASQVRVILWNKRRRQSFHGPAAQAHGTIVVDVCSTPRRARHRLLRAREGRRALMKHVGVPIRQKWVFCGRIRTLADYCIRIGTLGAGAREAARARRLHWARCRGALLSPAAAIRREGDPSTPLAALRMAWGRRLRPTALGASHPRGTRLTRYVYRRRLHPTSRMNPAESLTAAGASACSATPPSARAGWPAHRYRARHARQPQRRHPARTSRFGRRGLP